ncbi:unnamed protein product [Leuciscus chuanchicus]
MDAATRNDFKESGFLPPHFLENIPVWLCRSSVSSQQRRRSRKCGKRGGIIAKLKREMSGNELREILRLMLGATGDTFSSVLRRAGIPGSSRNFLLGRPWSVGLGSDDVRQSLTSTPLSGFMKSNVKHLGFVFDSNLKMDSQINSVKGIGKEGAYSEECQPSSHRVRNPTSMQDEWLFFMAYHSSLERTILEGCIGVRRDSTQISRERAVLPLLWVGVGVGGHKIQPKSRNPAVPRFRNGVNN